MKSFALNASKKTKSTPAGEIPVDWACVRLRDVVRPIESGTSVSGEERLPRAGEVTVLKVSAVTSGKFLPQQAKAVGGEEARRLKTHVVGKSILVNRANGSADLVGSAVYVPTTLDGVFLSDKLWLITPREEKASARFLGFLLSSPEFRKTVLDRSSGGTGMMNIGSGAYLGIPIQFPPLAEQRKIADILATWDEALEKLDALIEAKERHQKALMQRLLSGSLRFPKFGKTPWRKVRMSTVLTRVFRPIEWAADKPLSLVSVRRRCGGLFRRADVLGSGYKTQDLHDLKANDFLVSKRQVVHGAWALVTPEFEGTHVSKEYAILVNSAPDKLHMPFFGWLAQTPRMIRLARVASTGVHIEKLIFDPEVFLRDLIQIPPTLAEQQQIAETLDACAAEVRLLRQQRTALDRQKRGLMQRLLTGKIRV